MRIVRWFAVPVLLFAMLGCGLASGIQQLQQAVTQLPGALTAMPTALNSMATMAANQPSSNDSSSNGSSPTAGGLGISADSVKAILTASGQFTAADGTVNGQTATIIKLSDAGAATFPNLGSGFEADLIGDPADISQVLVVTPRSDQQGSSDQGMGVLNIFLSGLMSADVQLPLFTWLTQNYDNLKVGDQQQSTFGKIQATLKRTNTQETLEIDPAK